MVSRMELMRHRAAHLAKVRTAVERAVASVVDAVRHGVSSSDLFDMVLHKSTWTAAQKCVGLHMGFFAFFQPGPPPRRLYYQTGAKAREESQEFVLPYFRIAQDGRWLRLSDRSRGSPLHERPAVLSECFHASREIEAVGLQTAGAGLSPKRPGRSHDPRFAQDLFRLQPPDQSWPYTRLSPTELQCNAIFAPCGEMSASLVGWLLRRIEVPSVRARLRDGAADPWPSQGAQLALDSIESAVHAQYSRDDSPLRDFVAPLFEDDSVLNRPIKCHHDWARLLGLVDNGGHATKRCMCLLSWLVAYGDFVAGRADKNHTREFNPGQFCPPGMETSVRAGEARCKYALFSSETYLAARSALLTAVNALRREADHREILDLTFTTVARLMLSRDSDCATYARCIRFVPAPHLLLRAYEPGERSWLVYPIVTAVDPLRDNVVQQVGFFLGTIGSSVPFCAGHANPVSGAITESRRTQIALIRQLLAPLAEWLSTRFFWRRVSHHATLQYRTSARLDVLDHDLGNAYKLLADNNVRRTPGGRDGLRFLGHCLGFTHALAQDEKAVRRFAHPETLDDLVRQIVDSLPGIQRRGGHAIRQALRFRDSLLPEHVRQEPDLRFVLRILLDNAFKHRAARSLVRITATLEDGEWVLSVSNRVGRARVRWPGQGVGLSKAVELARFNGWALTKLLRRARSGHTWNAILKVPWTS